MTNADLILSGDDPRPGARLSLCEDCTQVSLAWLDTEPSTLIPRFGIAHGSGAAYDATAAGLRDRQRARHAEWLAIVRRERKFIRVSCAAGIHRRPEPEGVGE